MTTGLQIQDLAIADLVVVAIEGGSEGAARRLGDAGASTRQVPSLVEALRCDAETPADVVLMPFDGRAEEVERLSDAVTGLRAGILAILPADADAAIGRRALECGALDFVLWPGSEDQLFATTLLVAHNRRLTRELEQLRSRPAATAAVVAAAVGELIGCSPVLRRLQGVVARAADSDVPVLIEGAEGTGKTLCARSLHYRGRRSPFALVELEGRDVTTKGLEEALAATQRGTLLIENIEAMPAESQARLVRFLKERSNAAAQPGTSRLIATTSARLAEMTARGAFREDLYYRLNVFPISLPSLQERREDVAMLANHFLEHAAAANGLANAGFSPAAMILLESHPWTGNVAQLRNAIFRAHALAGGEKIDRVHLLSPAIGVAPAQGMGMPPDEQIALASERSSAETDDDDVSEDDIRPFQEEEQRLLSRALRATRGNVRRAAQLLGIGRATLYRKIQVYNLRMH
jgi:two-component system response regulator AtoC